MSQDQFAYFLRSTTTEIWTACSLCSTRILSKSINDYGSFACFTIFQRITCYVNMKRRYACPTVKKKRIELSKVSLCNQCLNFQSETTLYIFEFFSLFCKDSKIMINSYSFLLMYLILKYNFCFRQKIIKFNACTVIHNLGGGLAL